MNSSRAATARWSSTFRPESPAAGKSRDRVAAGGSASLARCRVVARRIGIGRIEGHPGEHRRAAAGRGLESKVPPTTAARSRMPTRPIIVFGSSRYRSRRRRLRSPATGCGPPLEDDADGRARACLATLFRASCAMRYTVASISGAPAHLETFDVKPRLHIRVPRPFTDVVLEHRFQAELVECCGRSSHDRKSISPSMRRQEGIGLRQRRLHVGQARRDDTSGLEFQAEAVNCCPR